MCQEPIWRCEKRCQGIPEAEVSLTNYKKALEKTEKFQNHFVSTIATHTENEMVSMDVRKPAEEMKRNETMDPSHPAFVGFVIAGC